jgi:hypothetical protein
MKNPAGQNGNYTGKTGTEDTGKEEGPRKNIIPLLHDFAKDFLRVNYMFWVNQEPDFKKDVMACFSRE